jgi:hypothetical protein
MDKLKDLAGKASGGSGNTAGGSAGGNEDYLDKGTCSSIRPLSPCSNLADPFC